MKYLAVGIRYSDDGCCMSDQIDQQIVDHPQLVANALCERFDCGFEEILVIRNQPEVFGVLEVEEVPTVHRIYVLNKHFTEGDEPKGVHVPCRICGATLLVPAKASDIERWQSGELIQDAMPYLNKADRELLISGTCGGCWIDMFGEPETEEASNDTV